MCPMEMDLPLTTTKQIRFLITVSLCAAILSPWVWGGQVIVKKEQSTSEWRNRMEPLNQLMATVRKAFRIKLFSFLQPGESHNAHPYPRWQPPKWPEGRPKPRGMIPQLVPSHTAKEKGAAGEDQENRARRKNTGVSGWNKTGGTSMLFLLWWSTEGKRNYSQLHALMTMTAFWVSSLSK